MYCINLSSECHGITDLKDGIYQTWSLLDSLSASSLRFFWSSRLRGQRDYITRKINARLLSIFWWPGMLVIQSQICDFDNIFNILFRVKNEILNTHRYTTQFLQRTLDVCLYICAFHTVLVKHFSYYSMDFS